MTSVFLHLFNLSVMAGWMVLAVLLLRLCLKKAPRWITCVLWGLVALRLLVPFTIESPVSLMPVSETVITSEDTDTSAPVVNSGVESIDKPLNDWLQTPVETPTQTPVVQSPVPSLPTDTNMDTNVDTDTDTNTDIGADTTPIAPDKEPQAPAEETKPETVKTVSRMEKILNVVAPIWLVGIGLMLAYELFSVIRVRRRVLDAVRLRDNVWQSDRVASPFIFGLFRPRIYVPYHLEEPVLEQVLSHERAHLHRRDHWVKPFAFTLLAVYWYNPLLWVGYILLCRDIEVACDERVVRGLDEDTRRQYATALLQCGVERRSIAACPLAFGEVSIKQRIKSVLNYRKPLLWVIIVSLVACSVAAVCLLTVPKSKDSGKEEEPLVVLSSKEIKPDQDRLFRGTDIDGELLSGGFDWLWEHAENPDVKTPDVDRWGETNIPLVVSRSKADLDALMDACSDEDPYGVDMRGWFELEKYDDAYFEDKVIVWLFVPGYDLGYYDYTITLEETNKGLRYAVSLEYESMSLFDPWPGKCEYLLLFETDRSVIEEAKTLTTRHEQAPYELPTELTMLSVGSADVDGDGEAEDIRLYHSTPEWSIGGELGYETAYLVVCKKDGTPILRECTLINTHSQCYLLPQEDGSSLLLLLEAGDPEWDYSEEEFGVLSLKDGERTVLDNKFESMHPTGWNGISFGTLAPYVLTLSDWLENAQLLYECDNGVIRYGDELGDTAQYQPLCWLDKYRDSDDDTLQDILETILASLGGETVSCGALDFDGDGDKETLSVVRYVDEDGIYQFSVLVVRKTDGSILTVAQIHYDYVNETRGIGSYVYWVKTENGYVLKRADLSPYSEGLSVYELSIDGMTYVDNMATEEWLDYVEAHDGELLFYFQGLEMHFPNEDTSDNYLNEDATKYAVENYNPSIVAYNAFLKGQRVAYEYGDRDTIFYVSDLYATVNDKGIKRYALADVTGDGVPELITEGYSMSVFTYQSGRLLRLYETAAGMERKILSNGYLWEQRLGGGNNYRYTKFFEIGTTRTVKFGDPGYNSDKNEYYVDGVWMNKADFDAKTSTYFANAQSPALLIWYDYATKQPASQAMVQYLSLLQEQYSDYSGAYYTLYDLNGDGEEELLIQDGTKLLVYTQGDNSAQLLVEQDFVGGTSRFLTTGDADYPGIIYFCVGGSKDRYYYLSLDNVENREFVKIPLWTDNYGSYEEGEDGRVTELTDDKKLIELSREAYQNNRDLVFALYGGSASTVALDIKYRQAVQAYSSDSKNHRDVGALQPETMDIIQIDGKYYQTYVSGKVDMRYIWLSQYEADIGIASWDWVPIGTEDDYSLSNIGKIDDGQRGDEPDDSIWYSEEVGVRGRIWLGMTEQELYDVLNEHNIEITFANFTYERDAYGAEYLPPSDFYYKRLYTKGHQYFYFDEDNRLAEIHYSDQLRPSMDPVNEEFEAQRGVRRGGTYEEMIAAYGEPDQIIEQEGNQSCVYHLENGDYLHFVYQGLSLPILFITYSRHPIPYSIW